MVSRRRRRSRGRTSRSVAHVRLMSRVRMCLRASSDWSLRPRLVARTTDDVPGSGPSGRAGIGDRGAPKWLDRAVDEDVVLQGPSDLAASRRRWSHPLADHFRRDRLAAPAFPRRGCLDLQVERGRNHHMRHARPVAAEGRRATSRPGLRHAAAPAWHDSSAALTCLAFRFTDPDATRLSRSEANHPARAGRLRGRSRALLAANLPHAGCAKRRHGAPGPVVPSAGLTVRTPTDTA